MAAERDLEEAAKHKVSFKFVKPAKGKAKKTADGK